MAENKHLHYIVGVNGYVYLDGKYLVIERGPKEWAAGALCSPGGGVEALGLDTQLLENELRREILEETGVIVGERMDYVFSKAFRGENGMPIMAIYFLCQYGSGEPYAADPDEIASVEWLTAAEIVADPRSLDWMLHDTRTVEQARQKLAAAGDTVFS